MTQPVGHRGILSPNYASPLARPQAGKKALAPHANAAKGSVQFGGVQQALLNGSVATFQNITEVFLWGFLAQDMIAMWLPRVWTSLQEGKETYDPSEDPNTQDKPFGEQVRSWLTGNWKGLNWVNFAEGTKREIATGPGLLAVPALAFMLNRALANPATELSAPSIEGLGEGLKAHLKDKKYGAGKKSEFIQDVKQYLNQVFADKDFANNHAKLISNWVDEEVTASETHFAKHNGFQRLWENFKYGIGQAQDPAKLTEARKKLDEAIWDFNRKERMLAYDQGLIQDTRPLNNTGKTWFAYKPAERLKLEAKLKNATTKEAKQAILDEAKGVIAHTKFDHLKNDMTRVGGYLNKIWANFEKNGHTGIVDATDKSMKELTRNKWLFGGGVFVLTAAYLVKLAFWAQNSGTYQATRLLNDDAAKKSEKSGKACKTDKKDQRSRGMQSNPTSTPAGLPLNAQPAFLQSAQTFAARIQPGNAYAQQPYGLNGQATSYLPLFQGKSISGGAQA